MREDTSAAHDRLDRLVGTLDLALRDDYARFLSIQLAARAPIEQWIAASGFGPQPPSQIAHLSADLEDLGCDVPNRGGTLDLTRVDGALGVAWVLAGSHLGNRMMVRELDNRVASNWPRRFLADSAMPYFWKTLLPQLDRPADTSTGAAIEAATATFALFLKAAEAELTDIPA